VTGSRSKAELALVVFDVGKIGNTTNINQVPNRRKAEFERRQQTVTTGKNLSIVTILTE
jgi:hypothetical protein